MQKGEKPAGSHVVSRGQGRRGFTLTEVGIVLGIIGIVIAAIFAAASVAQYRIQLNQGVDEISLITGNMRSLYASQNASAVGSQSFAVVTPILIQQSVFPQEMLTTAGATTVADNPWDQTAPGGSAQIQIVAAAGGTPSQFAVRYLNIPADVCADLLVRNSLPSAAPGLSGLQQIQVNGTAVAPLPISPIAAATACPEGATYTIDWYYTLGS
jgi:prepilin-type N-terminal cleavage/methylation domain-containing protein